MVQLRFLSPKRRLAMDSSIGHISTLQQRKGEENLSLPMSADVAVGPAVLINNYGRGKVIYLPCSPDAEQ